MNFEYLSSDYIEITSPVCLLKFDIFVPDIKTYRLLVFHLKTGFGFQWHSLCDSTHVLYMWVVIGIFGSCISL